MDDPQVPPSSDELPVTIPMQGAPRPGSSQPSASRYAVELPYPEELQALLGSGYVVESFLGQGGMGAVYKGLQMPLKRPVAIKILQRKGEGDDFKFEERFKREAYAMAGLTHPNIVQVYDCGDAGDNFLFISMELVEGGDLSDAIKKGEVTSETALKLIPQICDGLQAAHDRGIVHRDIKPANIFLTKGGRAKVADFGLAKKFDSQSTFATKTGMAMGTPDYAAPEQYDAVSDIDHRADIYSLGVMMYQMITGSLPRGNYRPASQRVGVDSRIDAVLGKAMENDRSDRYQSVAEIKADVLALTTPPQKSQATSLRGTSGAAVTVRPAIATTSRPAERKTASRNVASAPVPPAATKKLHAGAILGVCAACAALTVGAWVVFKPKPQMAAKGQPFASDTLRGSVPLNAAFPPGNWVQPFRQAADINSRWFKDGAKWEDGWITPGAATNNAITLAAPNGRGKNWGVRARYRWQEHGMANLVLRRGGSAAANDVVAYEFRVSSTSALFRRVLPRGIGKGSEFMPQGDSMSVVVKPGQEVVIEAFVIGDVLHGRVNGSTFRTRCDELLNEGSFEAASTQMAYRDIEFINLDGLPEAEALKLVGISEVPKANASAFHSPRQGGGMPFSATKDTLFVNSLGMKFVPVPILGGPTGGQRVLFSVWETRVQDYEVFVKETKQEWPPPTFPQTPTHPAVRVTWTDAQAFCDWLTEREKKAGKLDANMWYRLPSDHEWSCAGEIGEREDASSIPLGKSKKLIKEYPWGGRWPPPPEAGNFAGEEMKPALAAGKYPQVLGVLPGYRDSYVETAPVGSFAPTPLGLYDLCGNIWEWCEDWVDLTKTDRVMRGGSWANQYEDAFLLSYRLRRLVAHRDSAGGFRCILSAKPVAGVHGATAALNPTDKGMVKDSTVAVRPTSVLEPPQIPGDLQPTPSFQALKKRGGRLFVEGMTQGVPVDITSAKPFDDFVEVYASIDGWLARRANDEAVIWTSDGKKTFTFREVGIKSVSRSERIAFLTRKGELKGLRPTTIEARKEDISPKVVFPVGAFVGNVAFDQDGMMIFANTRNQKNVIPPPLDFFHGAIGFTSSTYGCIGLYQDQPPKSWHATAGTPYDFPPEWTGCVQGSSKHDGLVAARNRAGKIFVGQITRPSKVSAVFPPSDLPPAIQVRAGGADATSVSRLGGMCAAQMTDGTWRAWGLGGPLIQKVNQLGAALDLDITSDDPAKGYLIWIEP